MLVCELVELLRGQPEDAQVVVQPIRHSGWLNDIRPSIGKVSDVGSAKEVVVLCLFEETTLEDEVMVEYMGRVDDNGLRGRKA